MSSAPTGGATPLRSSTSRRRRDASGAPRDWIPTSARSLELVRALDDLVRDAGESLRDRLAVEEEPRGGVGGDVRRHGNSFPASLDRVKGSARPSVPAASADVLRRARTRAHERRLAALGERDRHEIEVARDDGRREQLRRLLDHLMCEVAGGDVREREQLHACLLRGERSLARRRVRRLSRAGALVGEERRLVHEEVRTCRRLDDRRRRRRVAGDHDLPPCARLAEDVRRLDDATVGELDALAALQHAALASGGHAQPVGNLDVESARSLFLDERVADRARPRGRPRTPRSRSRPARAARRPRARRSAPGT